MLNDHVYPCLCTPACRVDPLDTRGDEPTISRLPGWATPARMMSRSSVPTTACFPTLRAAVASIRAAFSGSARLKAPCAASHSGPWPQSHLCERNRRDDGVEDAVCLALLDQAYPLRTAHHLARKHPVRFVMLVVYAAGLLFIFLMRRQD